MRDDNQVRPSDVAASASTNQPPLDPITRLDLDTLRAIFPAWRISGSPNHYFAVRGGFEALDGPRSLLHRYLAATTLLELAEQLCLQEYLDGLSDRELEEVWQRVELPPSPRQAAS
jgi:hypothetical protein